MSKIITSILDEVQWLLPRKAAHSIAYFRATKKFMPWNNPRTYDQKVRWILVNCYGEKESIYADKSRVRDYVAECGLSDILIPCVGVWNSSKEIDRSKLPKSFIMKTTHGTGPECYVIVKDRDNQEELNAAFSKMDKALQINVAKNSCQYQYKFIKPRIIIEELLNDGGKRMTDYKVLCTNGTPRFILVCSERDNGRDYFDCDWHNMHFTKPEYQSKKEIARPKGLEKMLDAAACLSKPFAVARIDFYDVNGRIYFGEITLTPSACHTDNLTEKAQLEIGNRIELPRKGYK